MKKFAAIFTVFLFFALQASARGQVQYYSWVPSYYCTAPVGQFQLIQSQNVYNLTGAVYVSLPGYTYTITPVVFPTAVPDGEATLTVVAPPNVVTRYQLPRFAVVAPIVVDYSFVSNVPVHKFTLYINNPFDHINKQIVCLAAGATQ